MREESCNYSERSMPPHFICLIDWRCQLTTEPSGWETTWSQLWDRWTERDRHQTNKATLCLWDLITLLYIVAYIYIYIYPPPLPCSSLDCQSCLSFKVNQGLLLLHKQFYSALTSSKKLAFQWASASPWGPWKRSFGSTLPLAVRAGVGEPPMLAEVRSVKALKDNEQMISFLRSARCCKASVRWDVLASKGGRRDFCDICTQPSWLSIPPPWQMDHATSTAEAALATRLGWFKHTYRENDSEIGQKEMRGGLKHIRWISVSSWHGWSF